MTSPVGAADLDLVARVRSGETEAFEQLFRQYYSTLCDFARSYVGAPDDAEDLVATVFTRIWANRASWHVPAGVRAYLFAAVRHGAINWRRDQARPRQYGAEITSVSQGDALANDVERSDLVSAVWGAAERLPAMQRLVLSLRFRYELSWDEVVAVTGLSHAAATKQYSRGMSRLKELLRRRLV